MSTFSISEIYKMLDHFYERTSSEKQDTIIELKHFISQNYDMPDYMSLGLSTPHKNFFKFDMICEAMEHVRNKYPDMVVIDSLGNIPILQHEYSLPITAISEPAIEIEFKPEKETFQQGVDKRIYKGRNKYGRKS